jgi:hypothetical protein
MSQFDHPSGGFFFASDFFGAACQLPLILSLVGEACKANSDSAIHHLLFTIHHSARALALFYECRKLKAEG